MPPAVVLVVPGKKKGIATLGDITKALMKKPNVPNPYLKKQVGIVKFLVLKSTITPLNSAQGTRTEGTPSHCKIGRGGTDRTTTGTEQMPKNPPTSRRITGGAELSIKIDKNGHITRKKMGKM